MPPISWREFWLWVLRQRQRVVVKNRSMLPTLYPGDEILFRAYRLGSRLKVGEIIVFKHQDYPGELLIKRIAKIYADHRLEVLGDNQSESIDSRTFGYILDCQILGVVTCRFS